MLDIFKNLKLEGDRIIWIVVFALCSLSTLVVYSAAGWNFFFSHLIKIFIGLFFMYIVHKWKFKYFSRIGLFLFWLSIILLIAVFIFGVNVNEASRWLSFAGHQFQPSDIAKLAVLLFLARQLSKRRNELVDFKSVVFHLVFPLCLVCLLILPNNFSTAALVFLSGFIMMFLGDVKFKHLFAIIFAGIFSLFFIYLISSSPITKDIIPRSSTWVNRVKTFTSGSDDMLDKNYQVTQALIAIHNGGIFGVGPGKSTQRNIIPYSYSDFIFAIMIEEYGLLLGAIVPILLYLILLFRSIRISLKTKSMFGGLVAIGLIFSIVLQAFINMFVSVNIIPVTGQTLPLISMGGTSILFTCITIGIVLSISRDTTDRDYEKA